MNECEWGEKKEKECVESEYKKKKKEKRRKEKRGNDKMTALNKCTGKNEKKKNWGRVFGRVGWSVGLGNLCFAV